MSITPSPCVMSRWLSGCSLRQRRGEHEGDVALAQDVPGLVPHLRFQAGVGDHVEAEGVAVEERGLPGVADEEANVVDLAKGDVVSW